MKKLYILIALGASYVHSMQGHHHNQHHGGGHGGGMMNNFVGFQPFVQHHHAHGDAHHNHHHDGNGGWMMNNQHHGGGFDGGWMMQGNPGGFQLAPDQGGVGPIVLNQNMNPNYIRQLQAQAGFWDLANNRPIFPNRRITVRDIRRLLEINNRNLNTGWVFLDYGDDSLTNYISSSLTNAHLNQQITISDTLLHRHPDPGQIITFYSPMDYAPQNQRRNFMIFSLADHISMNGGLLNGRQDVVPWRQYQPPAQPAFPEMIPFYPQPQHHHAHAGAHHNHHHGHNGGWMMNMHHHHHGGGHGGGFMGGGGGFADPVLARHANFLNQIGQHNAAMMAFLLDREAMTAWINNQRQRINMNTYAKVLNLIENQPSFGTEVEHFLARFPIGQMGAQDLGAENVMGGQAEEASFKMALYVMKDAKRRGIDFSEQKFLTLSNTLKTLFQKIVADKKKEREKN